MSYKNWLIDFSDKFKDKYVRYMTNEEFNLMPEEDKFNYICYLENNMEELLDEHCDLVKEVEGGAFL